MKKDTTTYLDGPRGASGEILNPSSFWGPTGAAGPFRDIPNSELNKKLAKDIQEKLLAGQKAVESDQADVKTISDKFRMAECFRYGWGVTVDYKKTMKLYEDCAKEGYATAIYELSRLYLQGDQSMGVDKDTKRAKDVLAQYIDLAKTKRDEFDQTVQLQDLEALYSIIDTLVEMSSRNNDLSLK